MTELHELENRIEYKFGNPGLLKLALTHSSFAPEPENYERLEFLGDSIVGFVTAEYLYKKFPDKPEGELTKIRAASVCEKALSAFSKEIGTGEYLFLSKGEALTGGKDRPSILCDVFESLTAAIYLDGGIDEARKFVLRYISKADIDTVNVTDYKTKLQEVIQQNPDEILSYVLVGESGPAHCKNFIVEAHLNSNCIGTGEGSSKKRAEQDAAHQALVLMGLEK